MFWGFIFQVEELMSLAAANSIFTLRLNPLDINCGTWSFLHQDV